MAMFALGTMNRGTGKPDVLGYVYADAPNAPITAISAEGDVLGLAVVFGEYTEQRLADEMPTPFSLAVGLGGRDGTVHRVADDGHLVGWRREYPADAAEGLSAS